ncbi:MAG: hypothetical protein A3F17_01075 [Gammaproteobacteria bacterium RIFCSPHIGHO2_12_FULL_41_15]|nr:MAG: hypothetical protein A3F17_01075 [Gammaproteobacteria bacterium RIFCSPHIGHO2_12_FULL_41_15]
MAAPQEKTEKSNNPNASLPALDLVLYGSIGGTLGACIGTIIYLDLGTLLGATLGIVSGVLFREGMNQNNLDVSDEPTPLLKVSEKAKIFFASRKKKKAFSVSISESKIAITLPQKKQDPLLDQEKKYKLQLFEQAVTSRGTGVFPHHHKSNRNKKRKDTDDE